MKAKLNPKLQELTDAMNGRLPSVEEPVLGATYKLELLKPEAEDWVNANTQGTTPAAMLFNSRAPTVAAALRSIDFGDGTGPQTIEQLFQPGPEVDPKVLEAMGKSPIFMTEWRREQILLWVRGIDSYVVEQLNSAYTKMYREHKEALGKLENFSKRTPL